MDGVFEAGLVYPGPGEAEDNFYVLVQNTQLSCFQAQEGEEATPINPLRLLRHQRPPAPTVHLLLLLHHRYISFTIKTGQH